MPKTKLHLIIIDTTKPYTKKNESNNFHLLCVSIFQLFIHTFFLCSQFFIEGAQIMMLSNESTTRLLLLLFNRLWRSDCMIICGSLILLLNYIVSFSPSKTARVKHIPIWNTLNNFWFIVQSSVCILMWSFFFGVEEEAEK